MNRNDDLSENLNYTTPELPILTSDEHLSELPTYRELMHWHDDYEFILVTKGVLDFDVNGETLHIRQNEGLFVNSGRLHFGYSEKKEEVLFELVIVSPELIRNVFNSAVLDTISSPRNVNYLLFHKNMLLWTLLERIHNINMKRDAHYSLELQAELCLLVRELITLCGETKHSESDDMAAVKKMLFYIQEHYAEKLTVSDIAASAMICRNHCFKLFQDVMKMTPQQYLMQFRINKSIELMNTVNSMAEIAHLCGFCSQSHYSKAFKSVYGIAPKQYMKNGGSV
ncbi:MAG: helix-turn-helix transcriptional regulator [Oscillospiraceae bacterium]|nr:helix-turn-helix transcriptional regulator [Oscillospiraceae bacterium]